MALTPGPGPMPPAPPRAPPAPADPQTAAAGRTGAAAPGFTLQLVPAGWQAPVPAGTTLLQAAEAAGIALPSSCRNGTCRACLCRMASGRVRYTIEWPGLSREEKADGEVLPCVALAESDITLIAPAARRR